VEPGLISAWFSKQPDMPIEIPWSLMSRLLVVQNEFALKRQQLLHQWQCNNTNTKKKAAFNYDL